MDFNEIINDFKPLGSVYFTSSINICRYFLLKSYTDPHYYNTDSTLWKEPKLATETPKDEFVIKGEIDSKLEPETVNSSDFNKDSDVYSPPQAKKKKKGFGNYECADCDYGTDSYSKLRRHKLALHEGEPKYPCNQCTFAAAMLSHLKAGVYIIFT